MQAHFDLQNFGSQKFIMKRLLIPLMILASVALVVSLYTCYFLIPEKEIERTLAIILMLIGFYVCMAVIGTSVVYVNN